MYTHNMKIKTVNGMLNISGECLFKNGGDVPRYKTSQGIEYSTKLSAAINNFFNAAEELTRCCGEDIEEAGFKIKP